MNLKSHIEKSLDDVEHCKIKIFFIGYNNTGTTSLSDFFNKNNINNQLDSPFTGEYPKNFFNKYKTNLSKEEWDKRRYKVYSTYNIIHINEPTSNIINELLINFPLAIYILNDRKLEKWISTRIKSCLIISSKNKNITNKTGLYLQEYLTYGDDVFNIWIKRIKEYYSYLETIKTKINVINVCDDSEWHIKLQNILKKFNINVNPYYIHSKSTDNNYKYDKIKYLQIYDNIFKRIL